MQTCSERKESLCIYHDLVLKADPQAKRWRSRIARENDLLAIKIARRMQTVCKEDLDDLMQIARIGLLKAIDRFDPSKDVAFSSFAVPYIRGEILHHLRDHWGLLKIPRRWLETMERVDRLQKRFEQQGRKIEKREIAIALGVAPDRWQEIEEAFEVRPTLQLDDVLHVCEPMEDDRQELVAIAVRQAAQLPNLMRQCVTEHLLGGLRERAIAQQLNVDVAVVRQQIEEGLKRLREM